MTKPVKIILTAALVCYGMSASALVSVFLFAHLFLQYVIVISFYAGVILNIVGLKMRDTIEERREQSDS